MKNKKKLIPIAAIIIMGIVFTVIVKKSGQPLSVNTILRYTPENTILAAGVAGSLLSIITTTLLGEKISDPFSVEFMVVLLCRILVSVGAVLINCRLNPRKK